MTLPTAVNSQITDAITQTSLQTLGNASALSLGNLYHVVSQSLGLAVQNAIFAQQHANMIHQAATTQGVNLLYSLDTETAGNASVRTAQSGLPLEMIHLLGSVQALKNNMKR